MLGLGYPRDRWKFNNSEITFWPKFKNSEHWNKLHTDNIEKNFGIKFLIMFLNKIDSWAYPWTLSVWKKWNYYYTYIKFSQKYWFWIRKYALCFFRQKNKLFK